MVGNDGIFAIDCTLEFMDRMIGLTVALGFLVAIEVRELLPLDVGIKLANPLC